MNIEGSVALVTGANRGIGNEFVRQLQERGASKIYATARTPSKVHIPGVEVLELDITDLQQVTHAAQQAADVSLLINNAGVATGSGLIDGDLDKIRLELDTHFYGNLAMARAFAPVLRANGGGAIINVLSALSWFSYPGAAAYSAAKAAAWSLTDGIRIELASQGTLVAGLHVGVVDTDMTAAWDVPKSDPADVVRAALDGLEAGLTEILVDETARQLKASLAAGPSTRYAGILS